MSLRPFDRKWTPEKKDEWFEELSLFLARSGVINNNLDSSDTSGGGAVRMEFNYRSVYTGQSSGAGVILTADDAIVSVKDTHPSGQLNIYLPSLATVPAGKMFVIMNHADDELPAGSLSLNAQSGEYFYYNDNTTSVYNMYTGGGARTSITVVAGVSHDLVTKEWHIVDISGNMEISAL